MVALLAVAPVGWNGPTRLCPHPPSRGSPAAAAPPSACSTAATTFGSSGATLDGNRATTVPSRPMRNLAKFHSTSPAKAPPVSLPVRCRDSGWICLPLTDATSLNATVCNGGLQRGYDDSRRVPSAGRREDAPQRARFEVRRGHASPRPRTLLPFAA